MFRKLLSRCVNGVEPCPAPGHLAMVKGRASWHASSVSRKVYGDIYIYIYIYIEREREI